MSPQGTDVTSFDAQKHPLQRHSLGSSQLCGASSLNQTSGNISASGWKDWMRCCKATKSGKWETLTERSRRDTPLTLRLPTHKGSLPYTIISALTFVANVSFGSAGATFLKFVYTHDLNSISSLLRKRGCVFLVFSSTCWTGISSYEHETTP